jgi:hypothetical protein
MHVHGKTHTLNTWNMRTLEVVSKPPLGLNPPKADKSLCWTETVNPRNIPVIFLRLAASVRLFIPLGFSRGP